jgi:TetR/AcrR family transcriptional repressor of mexJK operon
MPQRRKSSLKGPGRPKRTYGGRPSLEEAEQLNGRILDAAAELFTKNGYGETSIEAIAGHAGIGKLTLYRRFADKDALFQAVAIRMAEQARAALAKVGESEGSLTDVLTASGRRLLSIVLSPQSIAFHRILFAEAARLPELCARIYRDSPSDRQDAIFLLFRRLVDRGLLRTKDVAFLDQQFVQAITGKPLRNALLGAPQMNARAQDEHVRKAVALFLYGTAIPSPHEK